VPGETICPWVYNDGVGKRAAGVNAAMHTMAPLPTL
jgi:hypothetical protein